MNLEHLTDYGRHTAFLKGSNIQAGFVTQSSFHLVKLFLAVSAEIDTFTQAATLEPSLGAALGLLFPPCGCYAQPASVPSLPRRLPSSEAPYPAQMHAIPGTSLPSYLLYAAIPMSGLQNHSTLQSTIPLDMKRVIWLLTQSLQRLLQLSLSLALFDGTLLYF